MSWLGATNRSYNPLGSSVSGILAYTEFFDTPVGVGNSPGGATQVFSYADFSSNPSTIHTTGGFGTYPQVIGSQYVLNSYSGPQAGHSAGSVWYTTQQNVSAFTTQFTFQILTNSTVGPAQGFTFAVQNSVSPPGPSGYVGLSAQADANGCGFGAYAPPTNPAYSWVTNSVGMKFDISGNGIANFAAGTEQPSFTGLYYNGGPFSGLVGANDLQPNGINLFSGHVFQVNIVYDGTYWTAVILDTTTNAQARYVWPVNIPPVLNSNGSIAATNNAYIGFTDGCVSLVNPDQLAINSWTFSTGYNTRLATPTFSVASGEYASTQTVTISYPSGSTCYYTTNGLLPTSASTQYTGAITISANTVLQAVAIQSGYTDSYIGESSYWIGTANIVNFPSGFASGDGVIICGNAIYNGSVIRLVSTGQTPHSIAAGAMWWAVPVNVQSSWTSIFTMQVSSDSDSTSDHGLCFVLQNYLPSTSTPGNNVYVSGGPTTLGGGGGPMGYGPVAPGTGTGTTGGILNSVAVSINAGSNGTGLYTNGVSPTGSDTTITGITLQSGHLIQVTVSYSGTTLTVALEDLTTLSTFSHSFTGVNITTDVGANSAYVGFTAGTGSGANIDITNWTYT
jgi:hypothetical protein